MQLTVPTAAAFAAVMLGLWPFAAEAQDARTFLHGKFLCTDARPVPALSPTNDYHFHEFKAGGSTSEEVCATVRGFSILSQLPVDRRVAPPGKRECDTYNLVSYTVMCKGGPVSAARFFMAADRDKRLNDSRGPFVLEGEQLLAPFYSSYSRPPDAYAPLSPGWGFDPNPSPSSQKLALPWQAMISGSAVPVAGNLPTAVPPPAPAAAWVRVLRSWWPVPQLVIGLPLLAFMTLAILGLRTSEATNLRVAVFPLFALAALGLLLTPGPATMPDQAYARVQASITAARAQAAQALRDREELRGIFRIASNGMLEPFSQSDVARAEKLMQPRSFAVNLNTRTHSSFWAGMYLAPSLIFFIVFLLATVRGYHYLFVAHPAGPVVAPPLRSGELFPARKLGQALRPNPANVEKHPPAYQSRNLLDKARALKERINADADIADAAMRRDRARAQQVEAEAELRRARQRLPWWQRWLWR